MKTTTTVLAWHFLRPDGNLRTGKRPPADGKWLTFRGDLAMCESGLHASVRAIDALRYAPGPIICRVECGGSIVHGDDKLVAAKRKILWRHDATDVLRAFARKQALGVAHLWDCPEIVLRYLESGAESLRAAARAAAWAAAWDAARDAARASERQEYRRTDRGRDPCLVRQRDDGDERLHPRRRPGHPAGRLRGVHRHGAFARGDDMKNPKSTFDEAQARAESTNVRYPEPAPQPTGVRIYDEDDTGIRVSIAKDQRTATDLRHVLLRVAVGWTLEPAGTTQGLPTFLAQKDEQEVYFELEGWEGYHAVAVSRSGDYAHVVVGRWS